MIVNVWHIQTQSIERQDFWCSGCLEEKKPTTSVCFVCADQFGWPHTDGNVCWSRKILEKKQTGKKKNQSIPLNGDYLRNKRYLVILKWNENSESIDILEDDDDDDHNLFIFFLQKKDSFE